MKLVLRHNIIGTLFSRELSTIELVAGIGSRIKIPKETVEELKEKKFKEFNKNVMKVKTSEGIRFMTTEEKKKHFEHNWGLGEYSEFYVISQVVDYFKDEIILILGNSDEVPKYQPKVISNTVYRNSGGGGSDDDFLDGMLLGAALL